MITYTILILIFGFISCRPQECDPIFDGDSCNEDLYNVPECDDTDVFADCNIDTRTPECFDSTVEIESAIFSGDTRQAFNDCNPTRNCGEYADAGYACAPSWTCHNNTIITDGKGLIDVRSAFDDDICVETSGTLDASDSKCSEEKVDYVCCKKPNFRAKKCTGPKRPTTEVKASGYSQCGRSSSGLKITGLDKDSQDAQPGEFPHMCVIYRFEQGQRIYVGGASLIDQNKVITVAHKFFVINKGETTDFRDQTSSFYIRCGEHNVKTETELLNSQETQVEQIIFHPKYDAKRVHFNLAILQTKENFVYQKHIGPVCLPKPFQNFENNNNCWSSGWGADAYDSFGIYSDSLKKVKMPVVSASECLSKLRQTKRFSTQKKPGFRIHDSWICVGGEKGSDTCKGDGGSPHVCKSNRDEWVQVGAVAWGVGCGTEVPAVYSSIPDAMCWIDWIMSCKPLAKYDIDDTFVEDLDIRGTDFLSKNQLTQEDCGDWLENNFDLRNECEVIYEYIDERNSN